VLVCFFLIPFWKEALLLVSSAFACTTEIAVLPVANVVRFLSASLSSRFARHILSFRATLLCEGGRKRALCVICP
jgi:hypothetical protein